MNKILIPLRKFIVVSIIFMLITDNSSSSPNVDISFQSCEFNTLAPYLQFSSVETIEEFKKDAGIVYFSNLIAKVLNEFDDKSISAKALGTIVKRDLSRTDLYLNVSNFEFSEISKDEEKEIFYLRCRTKDKKKILTLRYYLSDEKNNNKIEEYIPLDVCGGKNVRCEVRTVNSKTDSTEEYTLSAEATRIDKKLRYWRRRLKSKNINIAAEAVEVLGEFGDSGSVKIISEILENTKNPDFQRGAIWALGEIGGAQAVKVLYRIICKNADYYIRLESIRALSKIGSADAVEVLIRTLSYENWTIKCRAVRALGKIGSSRAIEALLGVLKEEENCDVLCLAIEEVGKVHSIAVFKALTNILFDSDKGDEETMFSAIKTIGRMNFPERVETLLRVIDEDFHIDVCIKVVEVLGGIKSQEAIDVLIDLFNGHHGRTMMKEACKALKGINSVKVKKVLIEALNNGRGYACSFAIRELGRMKNFYDVNSLIAKLEESAMIIHEAAIETLGEMRCKDAVDDLCVMLDIHNDSVKTQILIVEALGKIGGKKAVSVLIKIVSNKKKYEKVIGSTIRALGETRDPRAINFLIKYMKDDEQYSDIRNIAIEVLGKIGGDKIIPELIKAIGNTPVIVSSYIEETLQKMDISILINHLIDALDKRSIFVRSSVIKILGEASTSKAINALFKRLKYEINLGLRASIVEFLSKKVDFRMADELIRIVKDKKEYYEVRCFAAEALGNLGCFDKTKSMLKKRIGSTLISISKRKRENKDILNSVIKNLGKIKDIRAVPILIERIKDEDVICFSDKNKVLVEALGRMGDPEAVDVLIDILKDEKCGEDFRSLAADALSTIGGPKAVEFFKSVLDDDNSKVRGQAIKNIGKVGDLGYREILLTMLIANDDNDYVRQSLIETLIKLGPTEDMLKPLDNILSHTYENDGIRTAAAEAIGKIGTQKALDVLGKNIDDEDIDVCCKVAEVLVKLATPEAVNIFIKAFESGSEQDYIRYLAIESLGKIGTLRAIDFLAEALNDEDRFIRRGAAEALAAVGSDRAMKSLIERVKDVDGIVVDEILSLIEKQGDEETIYHLNKIASKVPSKKTFFIYNDHDAIVEYTEKTKYIGNNAGNFEFVKKERKKNPLLTKIRAVTRRIEKRLKIERESKNIPLERINDDRLKKFFLWLEAKGLGEDLIVIGGGVRDAYIGKELNDIDITFKISGLTKKERVGLYGTRSQVPEEVYKKITQKLKKLSDALGVEVEAFLSPAGDKEVLWEGASGDIELQYCGPVLLKDAKGESVHIKRTLVDADTKSLYTSNTGVSLLQIGMDYKGNLYGKVKALEDLKNGKVRISGDGHNFTMGHILRLLRVKHEFGLKIPNEDYRFVKKTLDRYRSGDMPLPRIDIAYRQANKVLEKAVKPTAAKGEMKELGIYDILEENSIWLDKYKEAEARGELIGPAKDFIDSVIVQVFDTTRRDERIIVGLDTSWIPDVQLAIIQDLLNSLSFLSKKKGLGNIKIVRRSGSSLATAIDREIKKFKKEKTVVPMSNIIIIGKDTVLKEKVFDAFREAANPKERAFFSEIILPQSYLGFTDVKLLKIIAESMDTAFDAKNQRTRKFFLPASPIEFKELKKRYDRRTEYIDSAA